METLNNRVLHLVMYLSTKSGVSFQTTRAFAVILVALLSATYLDVASDCEQQSKTELMTNYLSFVWSLLEPHSLIPVEDRQKHEGKIAHGGSHFSLFSHVPHA